MNAPVIDFHAHLLDRALFEPCIGHSVQTGFGARPAPRLDDTSGKGKVYGTMSDPLAHLAEMDRKGIDMHVVSLSTVLQPTGWASAAEEHTMCRALNDGIAGFTSFDKKRFIGSFTLPLQDIELSLRELHRAHHELGMSVLNLPACAGAVYIGEDHFLPLWQALEELQLTVFMHPHGVSDPWFQKYRMWNSIGQSIEETKALTSLIYGGIPERFPKLKIVVAHGGGFLPHYMGRLDRNVGNYPESAVNLNRLPSDYLKFFYYDTCVYSDGVLNTLSDIVGPGRLVFGTDFPVGERDPVATIRACPRFSASDMEDVLGRTAAGLLGLQPQPARAAEP